MCKTAQFAWKKKSADIKRGRIIQMKRFFVALATLTLAVTLMSCGGVKLENTIWKGSDDGFNYELSFTKKEMTLSQTSKFGKEYDKEPMTVKYCVKNNEVYAISNYDGSKNLYTTIDGNTMTFSDKYQTLVFTKQEVEE